MRGILATYHKKSGWQPGANLLAYYPMENDRNDHKADLGITGTTYNCTQRNSFTSSFVSGKVGNCLYRSSAGNASLNTGITLGNEFTIMMWIKQPISGEWKFHFTTKTSDGGYGITSQWDLYYNKIGIKVYNSHYYYSTLYTQEGRLHYVVTKNGSTYKIYINGVGETFTANSNAGPNTLQIMGIFDNGSIQYEDEVYIYSRELSAQEIEDYYNATKSLY